MVLSSSPRNTDLLENLCPFVQSNNGLLLCPFAFLRCTKDVRSLFTCTISLMTFSILLYKLACPDSFHSGGPKTGSLRISMYTYLLWKGLSRVCLRLHELVIFVKWQKDWWSQSPSFRHCNSIFLFLFLSYTWLCPRLIPGSMLKYHSWQSSVSHVGRGTWDWTWASQVPYSQYYLLFRPAETISTSDQKGTL